MENKPLKLTGKIQDLRQEGNNFLLRKEVTNINVIAVYNVTDIDC